MVESARRPLIAGNWKMNLNHFEANLLVQKLAASLNEKVLNEVEVAVMPPFTDLRTVQTAVDGDKLKILYGAQDISEHKSGAYTGEISGAMLEKLGCTYVLAGHSERRQYHHETDAVVNAKVKAAFAAGMVPILCVGELEFVREAGDAVSHCVEMLEGGMAGLTAEQVKRMVIAYEPVWAIGTGKTATPDDAEEMCRAARECVAKQFGADVAAEVRIQYGGSVKSSNIAAIMAQPDVDGALVGGASLDAEEFAKIVRYREHVAR
jgi:triosephosphate isomerase